jgi:hypothetical protein
MHDFTLSSPFAFNAETLLPCDGCTAAIEAGCAQLYSEDLNGGQRVGSHVIVNPFTHRRSLSR